MRTKEELDKVFTSLEALEGCQKLLLVGIAGAGMSGIARMLRKRGFEVEGVDSGKSDERDRLIAEGFSVHFQHHESNLAPNQGLVLTDAIDLKSSPEFAAALANGNPVFRRSQVLNWLLRNKKIIAVTGTHGKTTTTSMIGLALRGAGMDPTVVVGAHVPQIGSSIHEGTGDYAVIEACEAYDSLRDFTPHHIVLTNFESDHLDFHGDWDGLLKTMISFARRLPEDGKLVYCRDDAGAVEVANSISPEHLVPYGVDDHLPDQMTLPGIHNRLNARAATIVAELVGANTDGARQGLQAFSGAERRLQVLYDQDWTLIDDYAHHPAEIEASLQAIREKYPERRLMVVFQPHLYSRTADFLEGFANSLSHADQLFITDIYPAREAPLPGISSSRIAEMVSIPVQYVPSRHLLPRTVLPQIRPGDVVVGMGAGNISEFIPGMLGEIRRGNPKRVVVLLGGDSAEREVSLHSGLAIYAALIKLGYSASMLDVSERLLSGAPLENLTGENRPDVAFLAVHGNRAEDGALQGLCELLHLPYTGSDIQTSAIAMDKSLTKSVLSLCGLPVGEGILIRPGEEIPIGGLPPGPWVVKPNAQGSTVGLSFVADPGDLEQALATARQYGDDILIETQLIGMEISVPILCGEVLPAVEIVPANGRYDFASKYTPGATQEICPARLSDEQTDLARKIAARAYAALGCSGACRVDMIVTDSGPKILEVNTLPGMTPTSLLPVSAAAAGITFESLCDRILQDAIQKAKT